jgi:murein DD-endopeptidase MepM/ murein hydrolase activator NlpD
MRKSLATSRFILPLIITSGLIFTACGLTGNGTSGIPTLRSTSTIEVVNPATTLLPSPSKIVPTGSAETTTSLELPTQLIPKTKTPTITQTEFPTEQSTETPTSFDYYFPVQPASLASFAEGVASHGYPATDIFAPEGTKFVAVTSALVDFVSYKDAWDPQKDDPATRGGLSVAIIGDDGVRYYGSHLSSIQTGIKPGVRVEAGQLLGTIGHTGDARNTLSHLHFGISRPSYPEDWKARRGEVDPYAYLFAWRSGINITPGLSAP